MGSGAFSKVYKADLRHPHRGYHEVAVKSIFGDLNKDEIDILYKFKDDPHPNIIQFLGYIRFEREHLIVTELAKLGFSLQIFESQSDEPIPEFVIRKWLKCIAAGLNFLHAKNVIHRDIKSPNCLLYSGCVVKICDFGIARQADTTVETIHIKGTIRWMAPEMRGANTVSKPSDIYAFGMVVLEMYTRRVPFAEVNELHILLHDVRKCPKIPQDCPDDLKQ